MKNRKIIAMVVAFAAFMAVATSGLAAVTTTTTYNTGSDKVEISVDVTGATPGSEVTYLVKSNDQIVYIDQDTATSGAVGFDYKVAKSKLETLSADVTIGTNGEDFDKTGKNVILAPTSTTPGEATVEYFKDQACSSRIGDEAIVGGGETIYAKITVDSQYTITGVSIGGVAQEAPFAAVYPVTANQAVVVTTEEAEVEPGIDDSENLTVPEDTYAEGEAAVTKVMRVVGNPSQVGVEYGGVRYAAYRTADKEAGQGEYFTTTGELCAVRIILPEAEVATAVLTPYFEK